MDWVDKGYIEKRRELRVIYHTNGKINKMIKSLAFKVKESLTHPIIKELFEYEHIISYLIDGFLAFEVVTENSVVQLDPSTLLLSSVNGKLIWSSPNGNQIPYDKVIYISYYDYELSFLETVYRGILDINDTEYISEHVDYIVSAMSRNTVNYAKVINVDEIVKRGLKIKRILDVHHEK